MLARDSLAVFAALAALLATPMASAQGWWEENFDHNNPALYTNLNGGPDNLTINDGVANFAGAEGTYYGRSDLLIPSDPVYVPLMQLRFLHGGPVGVGWHSPSQNAAVSALFEMETLTVSLFEHHGFGAPVLLASGPLAQSESYYFLWSGILFAGDPLQSQQYISAPTTVLQTEDMHFFMYGWSSASGPGRLDNVVAFTIPEPSSFVVLSGGAILAWLVRKHRR